CGGQWGVVATDGGGGGGGGGGGEWGTGKGTSDRSPTPNAQSPTPSYEIYQDLAARQREEALRDARLREVEKRFREALGRFLEFARLSPEQVEALRREMKARGEGLKAMTPDQQRAFL